MYKLMLSLIACSVFCTPVKVLPQRINSLNSKESAVNDSLESDQTIQTINSDDFDHLPFKGELDEYYELFSGTVVQDFSGVRNLHVRGSRPDETGYLFEGADVRSWVTGANIIQLIPEALATIRLNTSPGSGENNAAAVLLHRLRRGGESLQFSLKTETDRFTSDYNARFGTYSYGYRNYLMTAGGPLGTEKVRFFSAGQIQTFTDHYRKFWDGFRIGGPAFPLVDQNSGETLQNIVGTDELNVRPGNIPHAKSTNYLFNGIVTADYLPVTFSLVGAYSYLNQDENDTPIRDMFATQRIPELRQTVGLLSLQTDYSLKNDFAAHAQLDLVRSDEKTVDPLFGDNFLLYRDSLAIVQKGLNWDAAPQAYVDPYIRGPGDLRFYDFLFNSPGQLLTDYKKSNENGFSASGFIRKKMKNHAIKAGGTYERRTVRRFSIGNLLWYMNLMRQNSTDEILLQSQGMVETFGYDVFGNKVNATTDIHDSARNPRQVSAFVEDEWRMSNVRLNFGVRYDGFNSGAKVFIDPESPAIDWYGVFIPASTFKNASWHDFVSPRFQATFDASNNFSFNLNYGKFVQQVRLEDVYASRGYHDRVFRGGMFITDLRGVDAKPVKSTQTELGATFRASSNLSIRTALFYKSIVGSLETARIETRPESPAISYNVLQNTGESTAKGLEFNLRYRGSNLEARVNYTLSEVTGFTSYPITNLEDTELGFDFFSKARPPVPLDFNQTHRGNIFVSYFFPKQATPLLRNTGFHLLYRFNSGHNFNLYDGSLG